MKVTKMFNCKHKDVKTTSFIISNDKTKNMQISSNKSDQCNTSKHCHSAGEEISDLAERVSIFACEVAQLTELKLSPIARNCTVEEDIKPENDRSIPPYFQNLRSNMKTIEYQLKSIANFIKRTDI